MLRFFLWLLLFYIVWKIFRSFITPPKSRQGGPKQTSDKPSTQFHDVQDAQFEDVTPKPPSDAQSSSTK
jgi:hypothetical protein